MYNSFQSIINISKIDLKKKNVKKIILYHGHSIIKHLSQQVTYRKIKLFQCIINSSKNSDLSLTHYMLKGDRFTIT